MRKSFWVRLFFSAALLVTGLFFALMLRSLSMMFSMKQLLPSKT